MNIKISQTGLSVIKHSFNPLERTLFIEYGFGSGTDSLTVEETEYTYIVSGEKDKLFDFLYDLSTRFDVELL